MIDIFTKIKNLIKFGYKTNSTKFDKRPISQISYDKLDSQVTRNALVIYPYGLYANASIDNLNLVSAVNGSLENLVTVELDIENFPNLELGEVVVGKAKEKTLIKFDKDNNITIKRNNNIIINIMENKVEVQTADLSIKGNVNVQGSISTTGNISSNSDVLAGSVSLSSHVHGGVQSGGANTTPPV